MMSKVKTVLFVPGFQESLTNWRDYPATIKAIEAKGYTVIFVAINWSRTTITNWVEELEKEYAKYDPATTILAGFSFGAMTAFMAAAKRNPSELWLFSLSPYFHEEIHLPSMKKSWLTQIGHRRVSAFDEMVFADLLKKINAKILFFYGDQELPKWPDISHRDEPIKQLRNAKVIIIRSAGHDVTDQHYIKAIQDSM